MRARVLLLVAPVALALGGVTALRAGAGGDVLLEVADRGIGVDPGVRDRLFEHFVTTKPGGTGLGLPFALCLVELHGGALDVDTGPEGSAFRVRLPAEEA